MMLPGTYAGQISAISGFQKTYEAGMFGQAFYVYQCEGQSALANESAQTLKRPILESQ
jgi:hypothetical protein